VDISGNLSIFAGIINQPGYPIFNNGTAIANQSKLDGPQGVAVDLLNNVYVSDYYNSIVVKITGAGTMTLFAGKYDSSGIPITDNQNKAIEGSANNTPLNRPNRLAIDSSYNLYIADMASHVIRMVDASGTLSIFAGKLGESGSTNFNQSVPPNISDSTSKLDNPSGVAVDSANNVYIADTYNSLIIKVNKNSGVMTKIAGVPNLDMPLFPIPGPTTYSYLNCPRSVAVD